jgi:hypothetical protein
VQNKGLVIVSNEAADGLSRRSCSVVKIICLNAFIAVETGNFNLDKHYTRQLYQSVTASELNSSAPAAKILHQRDQTGISME